MLCGSTGGATIAVEINCGVITGMAMVAMDGTYDGTTGCGVTATGVLIAAGIGEAVAMAKGVDIGNATGVVTAFATGVAGGSITGVPVTATAGQTPTVT